MELSQGEQNKRSKTEECDDGDLTDFTMEMPQQDEALVPDNCTSHDEQSSDDGMEISQVEEQEFSWSIQKIGLLLSLCLVYIVSFAAVGILTPFYPNVARDKGVSSSVVGVIFAAYPFVAGAFSPVCSWLIVEWGAKRVVMAGLLLAGACQVLFGLCNMLNGKALFIAASLVLRALSAVGGAACETAVCAISISEFPGRTSTILGILECCVGIGCLASPGFGGILYSVGTYPLPFMVMASILLALLPVTYFSLKSREVAVSLYSWRLVWRLVTIFQLFVTAFSLFFGGVEVSFLTPILSLHLENTFGIHAAGTGLVFLVWPMCYAVSAPLGGLVSDKTRCYRLMLTAGLAGNAVAYFCIGPAPFLEFLLPTRSLGLVVAAMIIGGVTSAMIFVPCIPDMLQSALENGVADDEATLSAVAGIFNSVINMGMLVANVMSGSLYGNVGFQWATSIWASILGFQATLLAVVTCCDPQRRCRLGDQSATDKKPSTGSYERLPLSGN